MLQGAELLFKQCAGRNGCARTDLLVGYRWAELKDSLAIDESTLMGKGVGEVARCCASLRVPCLGLAGRASDAARASGRFALLASIVPDLASAAAAQERAALSQLLDRLQFIRGIRYQHKAS